MWEKVRVGQYERITLKHVYYHMQYRWPVQVQCMKQDIQSWCSGTTQRDGVGREVRRGFRIMGHMYTHDWFVLMYGQNHHYIVKPYSCLLWRWIELKIKQLPKWKKEKKFWNTWRFGPFLICPSFPGTCKTCKDSYVARCASHYELI